MINYETAYNHSGILFALAEAYSQKVYDHSNRLICRVDGEKYYDNSNRLTLRSDGEKIYDRSNHLIGLKSSDRQGLW